jgi:4a-hydroxytetrahydrobiopterin dehydratase
MSEAGWRAFLAADGLDDWAVLHGGAAAAYGCRSMAAAASLAEAIATLDGFGDEDAILTIAGTRLTVRLTRDLWQLEARHADLARAVSAVAREHGARSERDAVQEVQLAIAAMPDSVDRGFWQAVLGYAPLADDNIVDPLGHGSTVWMQQLDEGKPLRHAMHVDVSVPRDVAQKRLDAALAAGGRIVDHGTEHWTLSDRAGNRVCIAVWPDGGRTDRPSVFHALGGMDGVRRLAEAWHARVLADEVVSHAFSHGFSPDHTRRLAAYWAEALGGPAAYTSTLGSEASVVRIHSGNGAHEEMDRRAIACFDAAMEDIGIADLALRRVLHGYFAWATTDWLGRYPEDAGAVPPDLALPRWGWDGRLKR